MKKLMPVLGYVAALLCIVLIILVVYCWKTRTPANILADFDQIALMQNNEIKFFENKTNSTFDNLDKSPNNSTAVSYYQKSVEVKDKSDSLVSFLKKIAEELMYKADNKPVTFDSLLSLQNKANRVIAKELMIDQKKDSIFNIRFTEFKSFIEPNTNSRGKEILDQFFTLNDSCCAIEGKKINWSTCRFDQSLIAVIIGLNADILHIRMLEAETINYLQTMQAKAMLKNE